MKKVFLVKKNPDMPAEAENWIVMNSYDFAMFMQTPEGERRRENFGQLDGCDASDVIIIAECGADTAKTWKSERDRRNYLRKQAAVFVNSSFSLDDINEEELPSEETIGDPSDMEEEVIKKIRVEELRKALESLTASERDLIQNLFLDSHSMSERQYGKMKGVSIQAISKNKYKILAKLKKLLI